MQRNLPEIKDTEYCRFDKETLSEKCFFQMKKTPLTNTPDSFLVKVKGITVILEKETTRSAVKF